MTLEGLYFVTFDGQSRLQYSGRIVRPIENGYWLVSMLNFLNGDMDCYKVFSLGTMSGWKMYDTMEEWVKKVEQFSNAPETKETCTCHERDSSFVCDYCYSLGHRGHMQK